MDQALLDLSYLLGETSVPTPTPVDRQAFIQRTLERVYRAFDFDITKLIATVAITNGLISLPTNVRIDPDLDIRQVGAGIGDDTIFGAVPYEAQDQYGAGDNKYWLLGTPGSYQARSTETTGSTGNGFVTVRYTADTPIINSSISTPFPSSMVLARGALVYYRQAEDPQADVSQLQALYDQELEEVIATQIRNQADHPAKTRHQEMGTFTGDVDDSPQAT